MLRLMRLGTRSWPPIWRTLPISAPLSKRVLLMYLPLFLRVPRDQALKPERNSSAPWPHTSNQGMGFRSCLWCYVTTSSPLLTRLSSFPCRPSWLRLSSPTAPPAQEGLSSLRLATCTNWRPCDKDASVLHGPGFLLAWATRPCGASWRSLYGCRNRRLPEHRVDPSGRSAASPPSSGRCPEPRSVSPPARRRSSVALRAPKAQFRPVSWPQDRGWPTSWPATARPNAS